MPAVLDGFKHVRAIRLKCHDLWCYLLCECQSRPYMRIASNIVLFHFSEFNLKSRAIKRFLVLTKTET